MGILFSIVAFFIHVWVFLLTIYLIRLKEKASFLNKFALAWTGCFSIFELTRIIVGIF